RTPPKGIPRTLERHGEEALEPLPALGEMAAVLPVPAHGDGEPETRRHVAIREGPLERRTDVVTLSIEGPRAGPQLGPRRPSIEEPGGEVCPQLTEMVGMAAPDLLRLVRGGQPLLGEFLDRLQHVEALAPVGRSTSAHHAAVDQHTESVEDVGLETGAADDV